MEYECGISKDPLHQDMEKEDLLGISHPEISRQSSKNVQEYYKRSLNFTN